MCFRNDYVRSHGAALVESFMRAQAKRFFTERCYVWEEAIGREINQVRITGAKTRWGSCNSRRRNLNFSWRAMVAPEAVLDYLVVHEMCHLIHPNHSTDFWNEVEKHCPNYRELDQWLNSKKAMRFP